MTFGEWLRQKRKALRLSQTDVANRAGVSFAYVSAIERGQKHSITANPILPKRETIEVLAKAVGGDIDEALLLAGYAPKKPVTKPQTLPELVAALEALGIDAPMMYDDLPADQDGEAFREVIERIWLDIELVLKRTQSAMHREEQAEREAITRELASPIVARITPAKKAA